MSDLDDLVRASLAATTDAERATIAAQIAQVPDVIGQLRDRLVARDWERRRLAMHFATRLAPPPAELVPALLTALREPLTHDPCAEETVLGLVIAGAIAPALVGERDLVAARVAALARIEAAIGGDHRAPIVLKLARDTLAKVDAAIAVARTQRAELIATVTARTRSAPGEAITMVALLAAKQDDDRHAWSASVWREVAAQFAVAEPEHRFALEQALTCVRRYASEATAGGEGSARMLEVHALERMLANL